ncbi:MAG: aspartate kinase [Flavobacteriales bacterium]
MKVFKFGGASVKDAQSIKNIGSILSNYANDKLVVVVSAMGKMTNAFEWLINSYCYSPLKVTEALNEIVDFHNEILWELFPDKGHIVYVEINELIYQLEQVLEDYEDYDKAYDSIVGFGELISTTIISNYLNETGVANEWLDVRKVIQTNSEYRQAKIDWEKTEELIGKAEYKSIVVTQGFIGSDSENNMTTLGREGSDFSAAIFGYCLNAEDVTIWKDVPGVLNADPKHYPEATKIDKMSYREAIELSYYGATVIHPKTIKPLENKEIPLYVKSFLNPQAEGTIVQKLTEFDDLQPSYIFIEDQILVSISPKDFSFIAEDNMSFIFAALSAAKLKVNLVQNSALSLSLCFKNEEKKVKKFFESIKKSFLLKYNENVTLLTIRHYSEEVIASMTNNKQIYLEQKSRNTARFILK